ncbi:hypothetical protein [Mitsuaria sp. GD03876]|uniref:hypothetical protein n=1 Tax=Mitsuaria sp. GD03876 TaxID=2975399 RepID=UPI00244D4AA2|nr:hypothetical protein [Mitsuaria sp. GD03876]MDH0864566.1 hypothetical protein [Mitsuaria sp. GD03876]
MATSFLLLAAFAATDAAAGSEPCFFAHPHYEDLALCGRHSNPWVGPRWNDAISSVRVPAGLVVELFEHANHRGRSVQLTENVRKLVDIGFNDITSSYLVYTRPNLMMASVQFAQTMLYDSADGDLELVADKAVLLKVNVTTADRDGSHRAASVRIDNTIDGGSRELALSKPLYDLLPMTVSETQTLLDAYSVTIPAELVKPGLRVTVTIAGLPARSFTPRVGVAGPMRLVPIPVRLGGATGRTPADMAALTARLQALFPVSTVTSTSRPVFVSGKVKTLPTDGTAWRRAFDQVLVEMEELRHIEGATSQDHYVGFLPKESNRGDTGVAFWPGNAAVIADRPDHPDAVRDTVVHELGHNFSLDHAPCGGAGSLNADYPYPNANLGKPGRHVWSYLSDTKRFHDPRPTDRHDVMSYCDGTVFSDYHYRKMQRHVTGGRGGVAAGASASTAAGMTASVEKAAREVLLISGLLRDGQVEFSPVKALFAKPDASAGPYLLRVQTTSGEIRDVAFTARSLGHRDDVRHFSAIVPRADAIASISVLRDGVMLRQVPTPSRANGGRTRRAVPAGGTSGVAGAQVRMTEAAGEASVRWHAQAAPFLTVTWTDGTRRLNLAQDLEGGEATLDTQALPAGGRFEFIVSDGLNARRVELAR